MVATPGGRTRRERYRPPRTGRHRGAEEVGKFSGSFTALGELAYSGAQVSAVVTDLGSGRTLLAADDRVVLPIAGLGRVLLLIEVSARITAKDSSGFGILDKTPDDQATGSGLWQHLQAPALPVTDLATLVGSLGDNLALNALLRRVGLDAVHARAESLGLEHTALLDFVRDRRGPDDAPHVSVGSTAELCGLFGALARGQVVDAVTSARVLGWLSLGYDLSGIAGAFGLDPLAHRVADHGLQLIAATGVSRGIRSEVGLLYGTKAAACYAVTVTFDDADPMGRLRVMETLRRVGYDVLEHVS